MAAPGMSVPGASDLGVGLGANLADQVAGETEEERRKRLLAQQQSRLLPSAGDSSLGAGMPGYSAIGGAGG